MPDHTRCYSPVPPLLSVCEKSSLPVPDQKFPAAPRSMLDAHCSTASVDNKIRAPASPPLAASKSHPPPRPAPPASQCGPVVLARQSLRYQSLYPAARRSAKCSCDREFSTGAVPQCSPASTAAIPRNTLALG